MKVKKLSNFIVLFIILMIMPGILALRADFAIYAGAGTWEPSKTAFKNFLGWKGLTWEEVNKNTINEGGLIGNYRGLFMPGGWAGDYNRDIKPAGDQHIRDFINQGGAYIGMSAGAFYACDITIWEGNVYDYPSNIFNGDCIGPIVEIAPWPNYVMTTMNMNSNHPANLYEPSQRSVLYYGEPYFVAHSGQEMQVLARWIVPSNPSLDNTPGIIGFNYGLGRVLLVGPHPEIEEDSARDGTNFADELSDGPDGSDWPFLWTSMDWLLKQSISPPPGVQPKQCNDNIDNDGDSLIDLADPGCTDSNDNDETDPIPQCNDGLDNDLDGLIDMNDPGCLSSNDNNEIDPSLICDDGLDNDGDTFIDSTDPGCSSPTDPSELGITQCDDGLDNDGDTFIDYPNDPGCTNPSDNNETNIGPVTVFFDDFEDGILDGWSLTTVENNWYVGSSNPYQGAKYAEAKPMNTNEPASIMEKSVSTSGYSNIEFIYYRKLVGLDTGDEFKVKWFDGSTWSILEQTGSNSANDANYVYKTFVLPLSAGNNPNFKVRFECTAGAVTEFCRVDNVKIIGK